MNLNPIAALSTFTSKVAAILPNAFNGKSQEIQPANYEDMSAMSKWMQQEKYMHFSGMLVTVPPGLNMYIIDHIQRLESTWSVLGGFVEGVLEPVNKQLAAFTHDKGMLTLPIGFRFKDFRYPLKNVDPQDLVKKLAASYAATSVDQRPIEKVFHSATEIDVAYNRAKALQKEVTAKLQKNVDKLVVSIHASTDDLAETGVNPVCAAEIVKMLDMASDWVELFGLFMKQNRELIEALNATGDRLKALKANSK